MILNQKTGIYYRNPNYGKDPNPFVPDISFLNRGGKTENVNRNGGNKKNPAFTQRLEPNTPFYDWQMPTLINTKDQLDRFHYNTIESGISAGSLFFSSFKLPSYSYGIPISIDDIRDFLNDRRSYLLPDISILAYKQTKDRNAPWSYIYFYNCSDYVGFDSTHGVRARGYNGGPWWGK